MVVYRIGKNKHKNDLTGEGARLNGGRWNHVLTPCIYTSESRALALLEYSVNVNIEEIPRALSISAIKINDNSIFELDIKNLPGNWSEIPTPTSTKDYGTLLLKSLKYAILKIPSSIISKEFNYILNPLHKDFTSFEVINTEDFIYDVRIKLV